MQCGFNLQLGPIGFLAYLIMLINLNCKLNFLSHVTSSTSSYLQSMPVPVIPIIRRFNPYNLQYGIDSKLHDLIQEIVNYAESRFWLIIHEISKADNDHQSWMQKLLRRELVWVNCLRLLSILTIFQVFVLSYVGMANAMGQILDIPIIIRSLAISIALLREGSLPAEFEPDFLATLDIGNPERPIIAQYAHAWWKAPKPINLDLADILDSSSLQLCLDEHRDQIASIPPDDVVKNKLDTKRMVPATTLTFSPDGPSDLGPGADETCQKCVKYKDILSNTLTDLVDIYTFSNAMFAASKNQWKLDMRRASAFKLLHEAALNKETDDPSNPISESPMPGTGSVRRKAAQEYLRLKALPTSSHKWTWGTDLTEDDVLSLGRSGTCPTNQVHSGYNLPLEDGRPLGEDSVPSIPTSTGRYEDLSLDVSGPVPDTNAPDIPNNQQVYDPLSIPFTSSRQPHKSPESPSKAVSSSPDILGIAEEWVASGDEDPAANKKGRQAVENESRDKSFVGDGWIQESDEDKPGGESGKSRPAVVSEFGDNRFVGDDWIQESDEDRPEGETGSQPASESSPLTQLGMDEIHELAQKWIAESEEYTPAVDAGSAKRFIGEKWLPSSDEDTYGSQFAGDENTPSSPVSSID
jgi:hypothetical protein